MLSVPITDTHVHLLLNHLLPYRSLQGDYTLRMYDESSKDFSVQNIIFMECDCAPSHAHEEVAFVSGIALADDRIKGIVASVPVEKGRQIEEDLHRFSKNPLIKGVRRLLKFESEEFCLQENFLAGIELLEKYNFSFEVCTNFDQNKHIVKLIEKCPDVQFMINHMGTPDIRGGRLVQWSEDIRQISKYPNVWCKLSSMATEADLKSWKTDDIRPYFEHIYHCFGIDRLVFGSDWPVSLSAASYTQSVELLAQLMEEKPSEELEQVFHTNALSFYRIRT